MAAQLDRDAEPRRRLLGLGAAALVGADEHEPRRAVATSESASIAVVASLRGCSAPTKSAYGSPSGDGPSGRKAGSAASGVTVIFSSGIP